MTKPQNPALVGFVGRGRLRLPTSLNTPWLYGTIEAMHKVLLLNGPNLNLLGAREPAIYGSETLDRIVERASEYARSLGIELHHVQSNHEGALIDALHAARDWADGIILNAGGYTHTSVALRDAISAVGLPTIEVHLSNIYAREPFRHTSLIAPVCVGSISGFGADSYLLAVQAMAWLLQRKQV